MSKIVLSTVLTIILLNILMSLNCLFENRKIIRASEDEIRKASSVLLLSIEENKHNHDLMKTGNKADLLFDQEKLFMEYNAIIRNCKYIKKEDVKLKIMIFGGAIWYFNVWDEEIYAEAASEDSELPNKIKRQMLKVFHAYDFRINSRLFDDLDDGMIILIYEKNQRIIGFGESSKNSFAYSKMKMS